jgi:homoserine O-acetyltransferase
MRGKLVVSNTASSYKQFYTFAENEDFILECGKKFGPITVAYEIFGEMNQDKTNVVLITHALTGDSHVTRHDPYDPKEGWWEKFVGKGLMFDTSKYCFICSNVLGGCQGTTGPSSVNPKTGKRYGMDFPIITIKDMVNVQKRLLDYLGVSHLVSVVGGSVGGMQALEWAVQYPEMVGSIIVMAAPKSLNPQAIAFNEVQRKAITLDPYWNNGDYYDNKNQPESGLSLARMVGMITYQSDESMLKKFGRRAREGNNLFESFNNEFEVESYLHYQGKKLVQRFDANSYLYLTRAMDLFELGRDFGGIDNALKAFKGKALVIGISSDILFPVCQQKELVQDMKRNNIDVEYKEIKSPFGHDGFLIESGKMEPIIRNFFAKL